MRARNERLHRRHYRMSSSFRGICDLAGDGFSRMATMTGQGNALIGDLSYQVGALRLALGRLEVHAASIGRLASALGIKTTELDSAILNARLALSLQSPSDDGESK